MLCLCKFIAFMFSGEIPPELWQLIHLTSLHLCSNTLTGNFILHNSSFIALLSFCFLMMWSGFIPPEIGNLTALTSLRLRENKLSGIKH